MIRRPLPSHRPAVTLVEFAVIAPVFFIFVLGLVEIGRALMVKHMLTNAARQGCRTGVIEGKTYNDIKTASQNSLSGQGIATTGVTIQVNDVTDTAANFAANPGDEVTVIVSVTTDSVSWIPGARYLTGGTISGRYTLRRE